jgi:hypothetical protein
VASRDILVFRASLACRVDPDEQPELGAETFVDSPLGLDLGFPLTRGERHAAPGNDLALVGFGRRGDGDEFIRQETCVKQTNKAIVDGGGQGE